MPDADTPLFFAFAIKAANSNVKSSTSISSGSLFDYIKLFVCLFYFYFCIFKISEYSEHNHIHKVTNISSFYIIIHF